jgi:hypothetical protein
MELSTRQSSASSSISYKIKFIYEIVMGILALFQSYSFGTKAPSLEILILLSGSYLSLMLLCVSLLLKISLVT